MVRIDELDQDLMRPGGKAIDDERLAACVRPTPRRIVHGHMDVADTRRHRQGGRAEHLHDAQVLGAVLDDETVAPIRPMSAFLMMASPKGVSS